MILQPSTGALIVICAGVLQRVRDMEGSSSSKRVATPRSDNDWDSVWNGIEVDGEREHQPVCGGTQGSESI